MHLRHRVILLLALLSAPACPRSQGDEDTPAKPPPDAETVDDRSDPPGAEPFGDDLRQTLQQALDARGPKYKPRTHHLHEDGRPKYTNRLILESSPYLLQHAHNPVDWRPWSDEAFATARLLDRPVILSVGYSTCHWCHVMEEESFEDEEIARFMNENFVSIKVDREERPDVDDVYMDTVNLLTGRGGWPMTVVMTPERKPFFGGTYFPPRDGDRRARKGFLTILGELVEKWKTDRDDLISKAATISLRLGQMARSRPGIGVPTADALRQAAREYASMFDERNAGFGRNRKFPRPVSLEFLLRYSRRTGDKEALRMATRTLDAMLYGGIHDQVGGGFHRYTVDAKWLIPHFEKMLYDNALLVVTYLEAWQATGFDRYARVAERTLDYLAREMSDGSGGFHSATDADSEGKEGKFFVWTPKQVEAVLGATDAKVFNRHYGITERGNFEHGASVLHVNDPSPNDKALQTTLARGRAKLYEARRKRIPPLTDTKVLTSWNALTVSAFARAGFALRRPDYVHRAKVAAKLLDQRMWKAGADGKPRLHRVLADGRVKQRAFLEDHAFLAAAFLDLFEATSDTRWFRAAVRVQGELDRLFKAPGGAYYGSGDDNERLLIRPTPSYDGAVPSGNSDAALNLFRLGLFSGEDRFTSQGEELLGALSDVLTRRPTSAPRLLSALDFRLDEPKEILLLSPPGHHKREARPLYDVLRKAHLPARAVAIIEDHPSNLATFKETIPFTSDKVIRKNKPTAYVCKQRVCKRPTNDPAVLRKQLSEAARYGPL